MMLHTEAQQVQHHSHGVTANMLLIGLALPLWRLLLLLLLLAARPRAWPLPLACCLHNKQAMLRLTATPHQSKLPLQLLTMLSDVTIQENTAAGAAC